MAHVQVNRTDSSGRAADVVLPECPIPEYTRRAGKTIGRGVAGQWIAAAGRLDPERVAGHATVEIAVGVSLRAINDGRRAIAAVAHYLLRKREHPGGHL